MRCYQQFRRRLRCETLQNQIFSEVLYVTGNESDILIDGIDVEGLLLVDSFERCPPDDLHLMDFQDVEIEGGNEGCLTDTLLGILAWKSQDDVSACQNSSLVGLADCLAGLLEGVASIDELQREVVGTLDTVFHDEEGALVK